MLRGGGRDGEMGRGRWGGGEVDGGGDGWRGREGDIYMYMLVCYTHILHVVG